MHVRYVGDNVVFFRIDSIHSPGPGCGSVFLFRSHRQLAKAQCKDYASETSPLPPAATTALPSLCPRGVKAQKLLPLFKGGF